MESLIQEMISVLIEEISKMANNEEKELKSDAECKLQEI
jgi:hypothetical protein